MPTNSNSGVITPVQRFWKLLVPDRKQISQVYTYAIFTGLLNLSLPLGISAIINLIIGGEISTSWIILVAFVTAGIAGVGILQVLQLRIVETIEQKIFTRSSFEFAFRLPRIRMEELYRFYAPELMNRFFDTLNVQKGLAKLLIDFPTAALQVVFGLILLSFYNPFFILFSLILIILVYAIFRTTGPKGLQTSLIESKHKYQVAHWLEEVARTNQTFKLAGKTDLHLTRIDGHVNDYLDARESHFQILIRQYSFLVIFKVLVAAGLLTLGGILVMNQQLNIGQFVAAEIIILLVLSSVEKLILSLKTIYDVLTALEKMGLLTDMELESTAGEKISETDPNDGIELELRDVHFTYPGSNRDILNGLNLKIASGEHMAVSGPNGSGKSTLLHLMAGLFDPVSGSITYNGLPIGNLNYNDLRSVIGAYFSQDLLFDGTLLENITMGREKATFQNVRWAVEMIGLEPFVQGLPHGYDTWIDPEGSKLPRSIVRKILLARSIADKPRLLLLEDPFEHLEVHETNRIIDFLTQPENPWTLVTATSNPYFLSCCSRVEIMDKGIIPNPWEKPDSNETND
jgi:ABC-type bacteriocin/lantibiotic exporter with double-glycine peptidase domain